MEVNKRHAARELRNSVSQSLLIRSVDQAVRRGLPVMYRRFPRLLEEIQIARGDGSLPKLRTTMNNARLLILDDWGLSALSTVNRQDLLDLVDDRTGSLSIAITSRLPIDKWYEYLEVPTIADAVMDRIVRSAHRIGITRESPRKLRNPVKNILGATDEQ